MDDARPGWREIGVLFAAAASFAIGVLWLRSRADAGLVAYDFYGQFYPFFLHAWRSLFAGGGLLWNPYQDCGQPFFANSQTGLLYPVNVVFAVLPREPALLASVVINLTIAGVGMFKLCRCIGLDRVAALCGALVFQLGTTTTNLAAWSPTHLAPFAWLPVALWRTERLIRAPSLRGGLVLGLVLAVQLLPGFPQTVFFTYQLIALRVIWAVLFRQSADLRALLAALGVGMAMPLLLDAVQLIPSLELSRQSVRQGELSGTQLGPGFSWGAIGRGVASQAAVAGTAPIALLGVLGVAAGGRLRKWRESAYYALLMALYFIISLGPGSILFGIYARLPLGTAFRSSGRLLWVTSFALAVLVGLGAQALLTADRSTRSRALRGGGLLAAALAFYLIAGGMPVFDLVLVGALIALAMAPPLPRLVRTVAYAVPVLIVVATVVAGRPPLLGLRRGDVYGGHAEVFEFVRARLTPQDRVLIVGGQPALDLMPKSAMLFEIPNIHDYEVQASQRYAEYFTFLRTNKPMRDYEDWYWIFDKLLPAGLQRPLFDRTAARYVIVAEPLDQTRRAFGDALRPLLARDGVRVYENPHALARARYVAGVVVSDDDQVLRALASGAVDPQRVAVVSAADGVDLARPDGGGSGTVEFVTDEPERVVLRVQASAPGFVLLADEYFPGWTATVNGEPRRIIRAEHTFRLVEVPAGESEVVFTYRPLSLRIGALVSVVGLALFVVLWRVGGAVR